MARTPGRLARVDLSPRLSAEEETTRLAAAQRRLLHLRLVNGGQLGDGRLGPPLCVLFEGWDAAGKGGCIRRLVALLDRSWYGRVLVERVEGLATKAEWRRAYKEIRRFERSLVDEGTVLVKLWLHCTPEEQLRRFQARQDDPLKQWKLTDEDWRNRGRWDDDAVAVEAMLAETDRPRAPWDVVAAEQKRYARVAVLHTVIARLEEGMRRAGIEPPPSTGADFAAGEERARREATEPGRSAAAAGVPE